jgi:hypothetical protein
MMSPITRVDNRKARHVVYLPRMIFVLLMSYLSKKKLQKIEQRSIGTTLCKGGFVLTFSRKVVFGPHPHGGIPMQPLAIEQLVQQVQTVMKHLCCPGENHDMLRIMLSWAQLGTGKGFSLLEWPEKSLPQLNCAWLQSVRMGLTCIGACIECTQDGIYQLHLIAT